jgi:hypothetical protein
MVLKTSFVLVRRMLLLVIRALHQQVHVLLLLCCSAAATAVAAASWLAQRCLECLTLFGWRKTPTMCKRAAECASYIPQFLHYLGEALLHRHGCTAV